METSTPIFCTRQKTGIMFKLFSLLLSVFAIQANAQNYLSESFDGSTTPPTGWTSTYVSGSSDGGGCGCTEWFLAGSYSGAPSVGTHTGSGMATYNSHNTTQTSEALLITPAMNFAAYSGGINTVSFWVYKTNDTYDGWYGSEDDSLNVWVNTTPDLAGATYMATYMNGINNAPIVTAEGWYQYTLTIPSSFSTSGNVYVIFDAVSDYMSDLYLDDVSVDHTPPCTGMPSVNLVPAASNIIGCSGAKYTLNGDGGVYAGQDYQWQQASSSTGPWTDISGATTTQYIIPSVGAKTYYRLKDSCETSGLVGYSLADTIAAGHPPYAALPFAEDFENWQNFCDVHDVPGNSWLNTPSNGDGSWRRDDEGCSLGSWTTGGCSFYNIGNYSPYGNYYSGSHAARFHSSPDYGGYLSSTATPWSGTLDLYVDCSGAGNKMLQFFFKNQKDPYSSTLLDYLANNNDSLDVFLSTDGGVHFSQLWGADTAQDWKRIQVQIPSTSATTVIRFLAKRNGGDPAGYGGTNDQTDIGLDSVYVTPACTGLASGGTIDPSGEMNGCNGASYSMTLTGVAPAGGITYQWQMATPSSPSFTNIPGQTGLTYTSPILFDTVQYQVTVTCPYTTPATVMTTGVTQYDITPVPYAAINLPSPAGPGYHFSFESWNDHCATTDQPVVSDGSTESNWVNYPSDGLNTWRRDDEGYSAGWMDPWEYSPYEYSPVAYDSSHSARLSTNEHYGSGVLTSHLYLFLDCSTVPGIKELQYYTNIGKGGASIPDTIATWLSTDGGATFSLLRKDFYGDGTWQFTNAKIPSASAQTVIDFQGIYGDPNASYTTGLGLDDVNIFLPCDGKPAAGILASDSVCYNATFKRELAGTSKVASLFYEWQQSTDSITWTDVPGDTTKIGSFRFLTNTYLRCVVRCANTGLADTSNVARIVIKPFYKCYCNPVAYIQNSDIEGAIGNLSITSASTGDTAMDHTTVLIPTNNNAWAQDLNYGALASLNGYTNFMDTLMPATIYPDSLYNFYITQVSPFSSFYGGYPVEVYIDYDHSGAFDPTELVFDQTSVSEVFPTVSDTVRVPHTALLGLTGMRAMIGVYNSSPMDPCGSTYSNNGEIRDYLININYHPCNGKPGAGTAISTDSIMCDGYTFTLSDTTHDKRETAISWNWQYSPDGSTWGDMPGTANQDTLTQTFAATTWYRLRIVCLAGNDTSYSNVVKVRRGEGYDCYCFSAATGGIYDSSDIGAFTFGKFMMNKKGPHLLNPAATVSHAGYLGNILDLYVDTTYSVGLYHTMRSATHADAKITLFMDYNNSHSYDVPNERVWTTYTSASDWYLTTSITIPDLVVTDVPTGMRLILNNNTAANAASDDGCGVYTSGETIDFVVRFNRAWPAGVGDISNLQNLLMYPNPNDGKFTIQFSAGSRIKDLELTITNMTGQQMMDESFHGIDGEFKKEIDLSSQSKGIYFVTLSADGQRLIRKIVIK